MLRRGRKRAAGIQSSFRWDNPRSKRSCGERYREKKSTLKQWTQSNTDKYLNKHTYTHDLLTCPSKMMDPGVLVMNLWIKRKSILCSDVKHKN